MTKTLVHFYPATSGVSAPYNVICRVALFGKGFDRKTVALDGARLSQPDGVRLEDLFPGLGDTVNGVFGIEVEISTNQPRVDLGCSWCVVECVHGAHALRYSLPQLPNREAVTKESLTKDSISKDAVSKDPSLKNAAPGTVSIKVSDLQRDQLQGSITTLLALKDPITLTSLIVVNSSLQTLEPRLFTCRPVAEGAPEQISLSTDGVPPGQAVEIPFPDQIFADVSPEEWAYGLMRTRAVYARDLNREGVRGFLVARDALTKRPVSISPLREGLVPPSAALVKFEGEAA
jgi:hypothetical protein